ncbi:DMT family transporter [Thermococcus sp. M39]|uniref:DMT family transporter n=1 Tax=unclassified Thermococcus TaxID=2627626 RepID=UPI00143AF985|nr:MULTISPECIES: DMT family transporter [unclassified Thermococcus]NJE08066.1 DMT family transporter [Thermococcus sp. M39]NJE11559.1 DMT family transporter [Thermococcus sp. LS2]
MSTQKSAYLYAFLAVLLWSTIASAFKLSLRYLDYANLLLYASLASLLIFSILTAVQGKVHALKELSAHRYSVVLGLINPFLYYLVLFKAYSLLPAQEAQALNYTWPIMLTLLSVPLLKQKVRLRNFLGVLISFCGVLIISTRGNIAALKFANPYGAFLGLMSALIWATYWILNLKDEREAVIKMFFNFAFGFIYTLVFVLLVHGLTFPPLKGLAGAVYIGAFEMGITFLLWLKALELSETTAQIANLVYLTPFISLIIIHFAVGEKILISTIIGLALIVAGIIYGGTRRG